MSVADLLKDYPPVLEVKDVMEILRLGRAATYRLMNDPNFGAVKVGGSLRIAKSKVVLYLENAGA